MFEVNDFVNAIADKLKALYPDFDVYADEIKQEQDLTNYFFVYVVNTKQQKKLGTRCLRTYSFDIFYLQAVNQNLNFFNWTETMMKEFKFLEVKNNLYHVTNMEFEKTNEISHFLFEIKFYTVETRKVSKMEKLILKKKVK